MNFDFLRSTPDARHKDVDERGLANPWLAGDEDELALAAQGLGQPPVQLCEFGFATDETWD